MELIYLDNAATTPLSSKALADMTPYFISEFGNASSLHEKGRMAKRAVEASREIIADSIRARSNEIYFTSGGTESDNWAIRGVVKASKNNVKHIITSAIEHPAVLNTCKELEKEGVLVTYVYPDKNGLISVEDIKGAINSNTILISIMFANNEIGTIQPIAEIGSFCREEGIIFHTDAVQAMGTLDIDVNKMCIDLLSMSAHKFNGPKGIGVLYIKTGVKIDKFIVGGEQERGKRAGTLATPLIVGMASALEETLSNREFKNANMILLRDSFISDVQCNIPYVHLNGDKVKRLPNNINFSFEFIEGESLLLKLDLDGIAVSSGSACASGSLQASHVIKAIGVSDELAHSTIRFSLGNNTTREQMNRVLKALIKNVETLREMSPLYDSKKKEGKYV
mgnify:FL=1